LARQLGVNVKEAKEMAFTMGKRFVTGDEAKQLWKASKEVTKESVESLRAARDELSDQIREGEDPDSSYGEEALDDLRNQLADLDSRIAAMENRPPIGARAVTQTVQLMPDWNRMVNDIREDTRTQLDTNDAAAMANAIVETQNLFTFSQQPHEFVAELERRADQFENNNENREEVARAIRNVAMGYDSQIINDPVPVIAQAPAPQIEDLDTQLFGITNIIRENYGNTVANVVDFTVASVTDQAGSINDNPRRWIDTLRQDSLNYRNETRQALDELANELEAAYTVQEPDEQVLPLTDIQISDIASDYVNSLDDQHPNAIRQEAQDMRNGMTDLPELLGLHDEQELDARNQIANAMEAYADMMEDMEPPAQLTDQQQFEQRIIDEALHFPRHWYQRYPDIPHGVVTGIMQRLRAADRDFVGMREAAQDREQGTIFAGIGQHARDQAVAMINDIGNRYQNEIQRLDNQPQLPPPEGHKRGGYIKKNTGGKIEPMSPSPSVNDQSKPVIPVKKIHNPDAPEFKDILNRERDALKQILSDSQIGDKIRGSAIRPSGGGGGADIKQMMNPRNITYRKGGDVNLDTMRYELLRKH